MNNFSLQYYLDCFANLQTHSQSGESAPHKRVLLLSVIDYIEEHKDYCSNLIPCSPELEAIYEMNWRLMVPASIYSPNFQTPFYHLQSEPFWSLVRKRGSVYKHDGYRETIKLTTLRENFEGAVIDEDLYQFLLDDASREQLRAALVL